LEILASIESPLADEAQVVTHPRQIHRRVALHEPLGVDTILQSAVGHRQHLHRKKLLGCPDRQLADTWKAHGLCPATTAASSDVRSVIGEKPAFELGLDVAVRGAWPPSAQARALEADSVAISSSA